VAPDLSLRDIKKHLHLLMFIPFTILLRRLNNKEQCLKQALVCAFLAGVALALPSWVQSGMTLSGYDYAGATPNSLIFGLILTLMVIPYLLSLYGGLRWFDWFVIAAVFLLLIFNGKRSVLLALSVGLLLSGFHLFRGRHFLTSWKKNVAVVLSVAALMTLFYLMRAKWVLLSQETQSYFELGLTGGSIDTRFALACVAWENWLQNPWLGSGAGTVREVVARSAFSQTNLSHYNHYHNLFLQWLSDFGLLGFASLLTALWVLHRAITGSSQSGQADSPWFESWFVSLIPLTICFGLTNLSFGINLFHLFFAFVLALAVSGPKS
jgi:O-antigen ligase